MGDTKKIRKKYAKPVHPWNAQRIEEERGYRRNYGLTNKKELWKAESILKGFKNQIKSFPSMDEQQAAKERDLLRKRLLNLGLLSADQELGDVLGYSTAKILDRRLQTIVQKKGLARTPRQARQMINHEHIMVDGKKINAPGYLVKKHEEANVEFSSKSPFFDEQHPERSPEEQQVVPDDAAKKAQEAAQKEDQEEEQDE